jgi:hypothetical protein
MPLSTSAVANDKAIQRRRQAFKDDITGAAYKYFFVYLTVAKA